jgi:hypothetical protein
MTSEQVQKLTQLNTQLENFLGKMALPDLLISSEGVAELLKGVIEAGDWIKEPPAQDGDPRTAAVLRQYGTLLERLRGTLPLLEVRLRMERARLESERAQLAGSAQWSNAAKTTLPG